MPVILLLCVSQGGSIPVLAYFTKKLTQVEITATDFK